ncbi:Peptide methionine sulfoxide reductase [Rubritalea squalenifaciens DSM 18772]|nr:Peptide methionine sulfoxide reductase [Rubritalea squalenifaciens DSM 18772]
MAHPIIVDSIENTFVPLLIKNNSGGKDKEMLRKFNEPAWNYQVIRFFDASGKDIIPRKDKIWDLKSLTDRMVLALQKSGQKIPAPLELLRIELSTQNQAKAAFAMHCFWTGERKLGALPGVITTEAGWIDGLEVTLVTYDQTQLKLQDLVRKASAIECANKIFVPRERLDLVRKITAKPVATLGKQYRKAKGSDQKRQLAGTRFTKLELTPAQATKVNAFARTDKTKALTYLTASQRAEVTR